MGIKPNEFLLIAMIACCVLAAPGLLRTAAARASVVQENGDGVRRIKPEEVRELLKQDKAVLVDVRGASSYKAGHIKGAVNIPYSEIADRVKELPPDKMIITYCS